MIFKTNEIYTEDLLVSFGALSKRQLADTLRDGRAAAFLVYEHLLAKFCTTCGGPRTKAARRTA